MELCAKFCKLIREAVGTKADLLFGTHGQFTAAGAIRFAKHIEPYDPLWFEEPTPAGEAGRNGAGRARHLHPHRHWRTPHHQI